MWLDEMATSSKFDLSASPDRAFRSSGQRDSFSSPSFDRSGNFRDSMQKPLLSSIPSIARRSSAVTQEDVIGSFKCMRIDLKSIVADIKFCRQGEINRIATMYDEVLQDDPSSSSSKQNSIVLSPEELKKVKAELHGSISQTRERMKISSEALSVLTKCFPGLNSRKRSRLDLMSGDRASAVPLSDRPVFGPKVGTSTPALENASVVEQQKTEEWTKSSVISKHIRTSLLDSRKNSVVRPSMLADKDRDELRIASSGEVLGEDCSLPVRIDGWEKTKMKKKRSGFKSDGSPSKLTNKPIDSYWDAKRTTQQRPLTNLQSRLNDSHGFRPVVGNEVTGVGEPGGILQQGSTLRAAFGKGDQENNSVAWDKKDGASASEKERANFRIGNKSSILGDYSSASPTSDTKLPASARAPRSSAGNFRKLSPTVYQKSASSVWEISQSTDRPSASLGPNNHKRKPSAKSSSPPVVHWASQRPQKISRTARRSNLVPVVSNNAEFSALDSTSDVVNDDGLASRNFPSSSPQQVKFIGDNISPAALSESEESRVGETKFKDKMLFNEMDDKVGQNVREGSLIVLPPKKNNPIKGEDHRNGVRRQVRSGHGSTSAMSLVPTTSEKLGNAGTAKQLRTPKIRYDSVESKAGRPPTRKISDRRAYTRLKHSTVPVAIDFPGPGDGQSELLAAVKAVFKPSRESSFWRFMESIFCFICETDIIFLKQQAEWMSTLFQSAPDFTDSDNYVTLANGFGLVEHEKDSGFMVGMEWVDNFLELLTLGKKGPDVIPLFQRLISALVTEEVEGHCHGTNGDTRINEFPLEFQLDAELDIGALGYSLIGNLQTMGNGILNGMQKTTSVRKTITEVKGYREQEMCSQMAGIQNPGAIFNFSHSFDESQMMPNMVNPQHYCDNTSVEERLLLEIQGIGIYPEQHFQTDKLEERHAYNDEISEEIRKLASSYHKQVSRKKGFIDKLLKLASESREHQEKVYGQCAFDKLIMIAYGKYMGWDSTYGGKNNNSKAARQSSLSFVNRTLEHCRKYEATGISCFSGPLFVDIFRSGPARLAEAQTVDARMEMESARSHSTTQQQVDSNMDVQSPSVYGKEGILTNKGKKRELPLDDVVGNVVNSSASGRLSGNGKGKRSEREREGKGQSRDGFSRHGATRPGRPSGGNAKGERKSKAKPKQKTTQLSNSFNGFTEKSSEQPRVVFPSGSRSSENSTDKNNTGKDDVCLVLDGPDLQLPGIDIDLGGQGQDLDLWLNIDDEELDFDFMGLEIPMDDLGDINMMV